MIQQNSDEGSNEPLTFWTGYSQKREFGKAFAI